MKTNFTKNFFLLIQGRLFSYNDTHRHRLGTNFLQIPVNCPYRSKAMSYQRDGPQTVTTNFEGELNFTIFLFILFPWNQFHEFFCENDFTEKNHPALLLNENTSIIYSPFFPTYVVRRIIVQISEEIWTMPSQMNYSKRSNL